MATIIKNRVLRPSTREEASTYKIDCKKVTPNDQLIINITHETDNAINFRYEIAGREIIGKNSLHFVANQHNGTWEILWQGDIQPRQLLL
jgi:hypothetical protein